jgi:eukaryotic-like serine/threonine-protein kinase
MGMLSAIRADRLIGRIVSAADFNDPQSLQAIEKLRVLGRDAIPKIISRLSTTRHDEARLLIELLRRLVSKDTLEHYFRGLADSDQRVVAGVVSALNGAHNVDPNRLLSLFDDPKVSKPAILEILSAYRTSLNAETLLRYAYKLEPNDQAVLFRIVDEVADEGLIPSLINRLDAQDPGMRARVARVLSRFRTPPVQTALHRLLKDENKMVRLAALEGLAQMGADMDVEQLCRLIKDPDLKIQSKAIEAIVKLRHPRTVQYLLDPLQDESEYARRAAVEVLNEICDAGAVKDLLIAVKDSDWWVRSRAADALGKIGGPRVVESVIPLIKDEDEFVRRAAIEIINATKDQRTYDALVESLNDSDWWVRERAIDALAALGNKKAVPALIRMLGKAGEDQALALVVVRALGKLGSSAAISPIIAQLKAGPPNVQSEAIQALTALCDEAHADVIAVAVLPYVTASEAEVRQRAQAMVEQIRMNYAHTTRLGRTQTVGVAAGASKVFLITSDTQSRDAVIAAPEAVDPEKLQAGDVLANRYRFIRSVGKGAFGAVFLMEDLMIKEEIILKFLHQQGADDEAVIKRFIYELRFARKITHPNVIRIFDMITFGTSPAIAMEYFPSHTLGSEIRGRKPMELNRALAIVQDICAGMAAAHQASVIHRDLKPNNILINDEGLLKIVDFGVAAAARETDTRLTKTGLVIGTPTYMAPEQVLGKDVDVRTDIYSLGIMLYEILTGRPPYTGSDSMAVMYQHVQGKPKSPRELNPQLPLALSALVLKAMAVDPNARFQSMRELAAGLSAFAG